MLGLEHFESLGEVEVAKPAEVVPNTRKKPKPREKTDFSQRKGILPTSLEDAVSGNSAKYWSTSFDQLEDADTNARLISDKLGLDYDPNASTH